MIMMRILALVAALFPCVTAQAQTPLEDAEREAKIEKAKSEAAASKASAKKSELELQQAEEDARLKLKEKQDAADERRRKALSEAATALSNLKPDTKDISVDGTAIETKTLAYRAVTPIAKQIVAEIGPALCGDGQATVVLADEQLLASLPTYEAGILTLGTLAKQYKDMIDIADAEWTANRDAYAKEIDLRAAASTVPLLLHGIAAFGALVQTFKTQMDIKNVELTIDTLALQGALAGQWSSAKCASALTANPNMNRSFASSNVGTSLTTLNTQYNRALNLELDISLWLQRTKDEAARKAAAEKPPAEKPPADKPAAQKSAAQKPPAQKPDHGKPAPKPPAKTAPSKEEVAAEAKKDAISKIEAVLAKLKAANQRIEQAVQAFVATSEKQPISPLLQLVRLERLATAIAAPNAYILTLKAVAGGGSRVTTNNFWRGPKVFHSGGAVLAYTLMGASGQYIKGGVLDTHSGYFQLEITDKLSLGNSWPEAASKPIESDKPAPEDKPTAK